MKKAKPDFSVTKAVIHIDDVLIGSGDCDTIVSYADSHKIQTVVSKDTNVSQYKGKDVCLCVKDGKSIVTVCRNND